MIRLLTVAFCLLGSAALAQEGKGTILLTDPSTGRTMGKVGGETMVLQNKGNTTVGKIGKDNVFVTRDGQGNTLGKVGDKRMICHTDPASGVTLCK